MATPLAGRQTGAMRLGLLGAEARRGYDVDAIEVPASDVLRPALEEGHTATRVPPVDRV